MKVNYNSNCLNPFIFNNERIIQDNKLKGMKLEKYM